ncbi:MAG: hypothetical protein F4X26_03210 [Chloroflexi bacterium]|nr:hypothetical protein [Chloroflexota bacterium]
MGEAVPIVFSALNGSHVPLWAYLVVGGIFLAGLLAIAILLWTLWNKVVGDDSIGWGWVFVPGFVLLLVILFLVDPV